MSLTETVVKPALEQPAVPKRRGRPPGSYARYKPRGYEKVRLGADPEWEIHRNGGFVAAYRLIKGDGTSAVGLDGSRVVAELRPCISGGGRVDQMIWGARGATKYEKEPKLGVAALLRRVNSELPPDCEVYAGAGCCSPLGGHIHFSGVMPTHILIGQLDRFITVPLNSVCNTALRVAHGYGGLGSIRRQPHGWEYRSPPSWLAARILTAGTFSIAWVLARAGKKETLDRLQNWSDLLRYARPVHARNIEAFCDYIADLKRRHQHLEEIEVLSEWGLRRRPARADSRFPHWVAYNLEDDYLSQTAEYVGALPVRIPLLIVGARRDRTSEQVVFLPHDYPLPSQRSRFSFLHWDFAHVGLSLALRQNTALAAEAIRKVVEHVNNSHG